jgi:hypothetical protein
MCRTIGCTLEARLIHLALELQERGVFIISTTHSLSIILRTSSFVYYEK